jgi:hypothetical protein
VFKTRSFSGRQLIGPYNSDRTVIEKNGHFEMGT